MNGPAFSPFAPSEQSANLPPVRTPTLVLALTFAAVVLGGCGPLPPPLPESAPPPPPPSSERGTQVVSGASDSMGAVPGSSTALYVFRFKQTEPASAPFNYRDRDLSFFFRPSPVALYFRVENLQGLSVQIDWEHSQFVDVWGRTYKVAHSTTRWKDRFAPQVYTQVPGGREYGDYVLPMDYLLDPGIAAPDAQPHQPLVPEDQSAPTYSGRTFGVDLAFNVQDRPRTYTFRFQIASVIPR